MRHLESGGTTSACDEGRRTSLHVAAAHWPNVVPILLRHGADVEAKNMSGQTPLYCAAASRSIDSVRALLQYHANPLSVANDGSSPLSEAQDRHFRRIAQLLQESLRWWAFDGLVREPLQQALPNCEIRR